MKRRVFYLLAGALLLGVLVGIVQYKMTHVPIVVADLYGTWVEKTSRPVASMRIQINADGTFEQTVDGGQGPESHSCTGQWKLVGEEIKLDGAYQIEAGKWVKNPITWFVKPSSSRPGKSAVVGSALNPDPDAYEELKKE